MLRGPGGGQDGAGCCAAWYLAMRARRLERRRGRNGKDAVDHPTGGRDDHANAVAGLWSLLTQQRWIEVW